MSTIVRRGWIVTLAGLGINLALGVLYSWSVIAKTLTKTWGWTAGEASLPYAVAVGMFAITMVFAGLAQDRFGPRIVATLGGALTGVGLLVASLSSAENHMLMVSGFGVLAGAGIGLGYAAATPAAVKWFPPARKGLITGIVVSGFGLASVYIAPLTTALLASQGVNRTFAILGGAFLVVTVGLAQLLRNPPVDHAPVATPASGVASSPAAPAHGHQYTWQEMVRTKQFALLWAMYGFAAFAGLMIIGHMAKIAAAQMPSADLGFLLVAVLAIGNAGGRIVAGIVSDRIGGIPTMRIVFVLQALMMGLLSQASTPALLIPAAALIGFGYGANLALFPSTTASYFGTRNLGVNYGLVFTAWGVGGVFGSMAAGTIVDSTGTYTLAYAIAAALCLLATGISFFTGTPDTVPVSSPAPRGRLGTAAQAAPLGS